MIRIRKRKKKIMFPVKSQSRVEFDVFSQLSFKNFSSFSLSYSSNPINEQKLKETIERKEELTKCQSHHTDERAKSSFSLSSQFSVFNPP